MRLRPKQIAREGANSGDVLTWNSSSGIWAPAAAAAGSSGSGWTKEIDNPLTSTTGISFDNTTWSINTYLQLVTTTSAWHAARIDTSLSSGIGYATEVEVEIQSSFSAGTGRYIALGFIEAGSADIGTSVQTLYMRLNGRSLLEVESSTVVIGSAPITTLTDGWHTLRLVQTGATTIYYVDGVVVLRLLGQFSMDLPNGIRPFVGGYGAWTARWRNLKAWSAPIGTLP